MLALAPATMLHGFPLPLFFALQAVILGLLLWSTVTERDRWPFSHYPMFGVATDADAVRFFVLRVHLENGMTADLRGAADPLTDPFHREFERLWAAGPLSAEIADEVVLRYWREASRLDRRLAPAGRIEVVMRIGRLIRDGDVVVGEKAVHAVKTVCSEIGG